MTPATAERYTPAWHVLEEADERAWLDQWAQLHLVPITPHPEPAAAAPALELAVAGRP